MRKNGTKTNLLSPFFLPFLPPLPTEQNSRAVCLHVRVTAPSLSFLSLFVPKIVRFRLSIAPSLPLSPFALSLSVRQKKKKGTCM